MGTGPSDVSGDVTVSLVRGAERHPALLRWRRAGSPPQYRLQLVWMGPELGATGADAFEALAALRVQLEPSGWFVAVHGARRDTYPGDCDSGGGFSVYVLQIGRPVRPEDQVATFDEADPALLGTVAEQEEHWRLWQAWLRAP